MVPPLSWLQARQELSRTNRTYIEACALSGPMSNLRNDLSHVELSQN